MIVAGGPHQTPSNSGYALGPKRPGPSGHVQRDRTVGGKRCAFSLMYMNRGGRRVRGVFELRSRWTSRIAATLSDKPAKGIGSAEVNGLQAIVRLCFRKRSADQILLRNVSRVREADEQEKGGASRRAWLTALPLVEGRADRGPGSGPVRFLLFQRLIDVCSNSGSKARAVLLNTIDVPLFNVDWKSRAECPDQAGAAVPLTSAFASVSKEKRAELSVPLRCCTARSMEEAERQEKPRSAVRRAGSSDNTEKAHGPPERPGPSGHFPGAATGGRKRYAFSMLWRIRGGRPAAVFDDSVARKASHSRNVNRHLAPQILCRQLLLHHWRRRRLRKIQEQTAGAFVCA